MAEETQEEKDAKELARKRMEKSFADIVQSSLDQFTPGMSAYDRMLASQGYGVDGPPVDYNLPGGSRGTTYSLMAGQPYANYDSRFLSAPSGVGAPVIPNIPSDAGVISIDGSKDVSDPSLSLEEIIEGIESSIPVNVDGVSDSNYGINIPSYGPNVSDSRFINPDVDNVSNNNRSGVIAEGIRNLFNPDKTIGGRNLQYGKDYNVRDRVFKNPEFENLLGNILSATSGLGAVPVFGDALSKVTGGGIGLLLKVLEKVPGIGGLVKQGGDFLDDKSKTISEIIGQGSTNPFDVAKGTVGYLADKVAPNRPGFLLQKTSESGEKTHGIKTLLNRVADAVAENRPNILLREYDEKTGKLTGNNLVKQGINALQDIMPRNVRASMKKATNINPNLLDEINKTSTITREEIAQAIADETNQFSDTDVETAEFLKNVLENLDSDSSSQDQVSRGYTGNLMNVNPDAGYGGSNYSGALLGSSPFASTYVPSIGDDIAIGRWDSSTRNTPNYTGTIESADADIFNTPGFSNGGYPRKNGRISGPGTERSDDIPAMLSDGEFVTNAAALRGIGRMAGAPANNREEQRRLGAREMYKLQRQGMKAAGVV